MLKYRAADAHDLMRRTKKEDGETVKEYLIKMSQLGSTNKIDDASVIRYTVRGIRDKTINKSMLYGATNFIEFKIKIRAYEPFEHESNFLSRRRK